MPDRYFFALVAAFGVFFLGGIVVLAITQDGKIDAQRARCDAAGGVYVLVKDSPDLCLRTQTIDIGATK